jgi:hypothetical protein
MGIEGITNVTIENITAIVSGSSPQDFFLLVNHVVYGGILYFALLLLLWLIIYLFAQKTEDQPLNNMFYSSLLVSVIGFFSRAIYTTYNGGIISMLTDSQLWMFAILTTLFGTILWASKKE